MHTRRTSALGQCVARASAGATALALALASLDASAHAPPLAARVLASTDGSDIIVTNRGLVFREPATGAARLLCNEALRITTAELPSVAVTADGALIVASSSGLRQSRDHGCSWSDIGQMETRNTPALAQDPHDPDTIFVATYDGSDPGLRVTRDGGATWMLALSTDAGDYVRSLLISPADPAYVYATVTTFAPSARPVHALLGSRDGGRSWQRTPLPLLDTDNSAIAAAGAPDDPETVILYTVANSPGLDDGRLLRSADAGTTFELVMTRSEIRSASFASDGRLWVAARDGLFGASADGRTFEQLSNATQLGCVQDQDGALLVCGHYAGAATATSGVGMFDAQTQRFAPVLDFENVDERVSCPIDSLTEALCQTPWRDWQAELLTGSLGASGVGGTGGVSGVSGPPAGWAGSAPRVTPDAGTLPEPSVSDGEDADQAQSAGCSLPLAGKRGSVDGWLALCGLVAIAFGRRR